MSLRYYTFSYDNGASEAIRFDETTYTFNDLRGESSVGGERLPSKLSINGETVTRQQYYDQSQLYSANETISLLYSNYASGGTSFELEQMLQETLDNTQATLTRLSGK